MGARREADDGFEEAFDGLLASARAVARRLVGGGAAADDVAAEALARAYARWPKVRDLDYRDAWVMRVTANVALDTLRRARRMAPVDARHVTDPQADAVTRLALAEALRRLPRRQRDVVVLRYLADLSEADVAESLGVSAGTVKQHAHRALGALRRALGPGFLTGQEST
ncbi:MAG TPA: sigma-70 family RNA polymerase sigma factor [Acidimicrobiia bacterium]|jgi:RNA polymerase sigma-70 factor (sigma-E family)|nr:sigma-70 family RNA polymerase sigma factor [Acidimicrobiia bacterium]